MFCMDSVAAFWLTERSDSAKLMDRSARSAQERVGEVLWCLK